jgi:photosystem II stability/assembly factor-like uncharacterized protein
MSERVTHLRKGMLWWCVLALAGVSMAGPAFGQAQGQRGQRGQRQQPPQAAPAPAAAEKPTFTSAMANLRWRSIGPAIMGGRTDDFAVVESNPSIVYVGLASGGVWKTVNGGTTWEPVFDDQPVSTIGDVTVAPSDPCTVWVGTGEPNNRQSSSWGNGVYKSADCGKTWQHTGLAETHHIGRIVVHPANPNVAYVAAVGRLWGASKERGVYKTTDGGKTWTNVLFVNEDTGVVDIALDWESPDTLYAAAYQRRRTVFGFNGSGPHGGVYKTTDGGATWRKLAGGLPTAERGEIGRIGLQVYRRNTNIVYALVEHKEGGLFRSDDKGETWRKMSDTNPRPMYYSKVHLDPNNDLRIWVLGAPVYYSEDGGRTFVTTRGQRIHGDYHAMWINPANSDHLIVGTDGGIHWTYDGGRSWDYVNTLAIGQFYEVGLDMQKPYNVCGGLQDNGSWCGPSQTWWNQGITNAEWFRVGGGDGFYVQIDYSDPNIVYSESQDGNLSRRDLRTNESKSIRPREEEGEARYRFQWNSPIVISAHDPKTIYYGGNFVFKSNDRGDTWTKASPDLTTGQDRDKLPIMGKVPDAETRSRHDGVQQWPAITTLSESALDANVLWAGTDDGNLQVTRDGGKNWKNVAEKVPGVPKGTYVTRVVASRHAAGTAYVTFDGHRSDDFGIYVFATTDYGETWKAISNGIPRSNGVINVIREHHRNPDLLFVGGEYGAFVSFDRGANWVPLRMNLPTVPVDDIAIHPRENDLVFGTHGRSIWVLDDITPLEQMNAQVLDAELHLFDLRPATQWRTYGNKGSTGHKIFQVPNPPNGALINFYLKAAPAADQRMRIQILDKDGKTVQEINCGRPTPPQQQQQQQAAAQAAQIAAAAGFGITPAPPCDPKPGINRVVWNLRARSPIPPGAGPGAGFGPGGFGGAGAGPRVDPGEYTVKVIMGQKEVSKKLTVEEDPRITISEADRAARRSAINRLMELVGPAVMAQRGITGLRTTLNQTLEAWKRPGAPRIPDNVRQAAEDLFKKAEDVCLKFGNRNQCAIQDPGAQLGTAGPPLVWIPPTITQQLTQLFGAIEGWTAAPNAKQLADMERLAGQLRQYGDQVRALVTAELANLNKLMNDAGIPHIRLPQAGPPGGPPGMDDE